MVSEINLFDVIDNRHKSTLPSLPAVRTHLKCDRNKVLNRAKPFNPKGYRAKPLPSPLYQSTPRKVKESNDVVKVLGGITIRKVNPISYTRLPSVMTGTTPIHITGDFLKMVRS